MRGALTGSALVHAVLLIVLMLVRTPTPIVISGPESVQVALLDPSALAAVAPAPAPERPAPPPEDDEGVRIEKKKEEPPRPAREPEPRRPESAKPPARDEKPTRTPSAAMTSLPMAGLGGPGLRGSVSVDARDFEFTYYLKLVRDQIARNWSAPAGLGTGGKPVQAVVQFRVARNGSISGVRVEEPSGVDFFDQSAARAVTISDPLPPLPLGFPAGDLGVHFGFEYTGP